MAKNRGIDWGRFIDIGARAPTAAIPTRSRRPTADMKKRLQFAYRIDTSVVTPLSVLPAAVASDQPPSLAQRNLLRGFELGLPTGQGVAKAMGVTPLTDDQIIIGKAVDEPAEAMSLGRSRSCRNSPPSGQVPAMDLHSCRSRCTRRQVNIPVTPATKITTPQLGAVGGRIVAEVFLGMLFGDNDSFLSADPEWIPTIGNVKGQFALRDMVAYALGE